MTHEPGSRGGHAHERACVHLEARQNVQLVTRCHTISAGPPAFPICMPDRAFASITVSALCAPTHAHCSRLHGRFSTDHRRSHSVFITLQKRLLVLSCFMELYRWWCSNKLQPYGDDAWRADSRAGQTGSSVRRKGRILRDSHVSPSTCFVFVSQRILQSPDLS